MNIKASKVVYPQKHKQLLLLNYHDLTHNLENTKQDIYASKHLFRTVPNIQYLILSLTTSELRQES